MKIMQRRKFLKNLAWGAASLVISADKLIACVSEPTEFALQKPPFAPPRLRYAFERFEPYLDAKNLALHYHIHWQYADELNAIIKKQPELQELTLIQILQGSVPFAEDALSANLRNAAGGYYNHSLFWNGLKPAPSAYLSSELRIQNQFLNLNKLLEQTIEEAQALNGSGWVWLLKNDKGFISVGSTPNEDNPLMPNAAVSGFPILGIDMWEHSYFTKFQHSKEMYIRSIWKCIDWQKLFNLYEKPHML
jgi:Fe-Mn family superoxide dismutase